MFVIVLVVASGDGGRDVVFDRQTRSCVRFEAFGVCPSVCPNKRSPASIASFYLYPRRASMRGPPSGAAAPTHRRA